jgi:hypothetical protein
MSGQLTAEGMALLRTALDPLAAPAPATDGEHDVRSAGQRLADALVELARRAIAADSFEANHGISHRVMVMVGLDTLTAGHECPQVDDNVDDDHGDTRGDDPRRRYVNGATTANGDGAATGAAPAASGPAARPASPRRTDAGSSSSAYCPIAERAAGRVDAGVAPGG